MRTLFTLLAIAVVAIGGFVYFRRRKHQTVAFSSSPVLDLNEIQYVQCLQLDAIIDYLTLYFENNDVESAKMDLNVLPNDAVLKLFKLKDIVPAEYLSSCVALIIRDIDNECILTWKIVVCNTISPELNIVKENGIYKIPIE